MAADRNGDYQVEMQTEQQHRDLAAVLHGVKGTVLLSGYASPLYEELYEGWARYEKSVLRRSSQGRGRKGTTRMTEVLWCSRPLDDRLFEH